VRQREQRRGPAPAVSVVKDANGITWSIHTHVEDVSDDEPQRRMAD
jgi:hypothetical protein